MAPTLFITGLSGYVGGHITAQLIEKHPEYTINALVRDEKQAQTIKAKLPNVNAIIGDLDAHQVLVDASENADVVLNFASSDHLNAVKSMIEGLSNRIKAGKSGKLIHISGSGVLADFAPQGPGYESPKIYSDIKNIDEITSLPMSAFHREIDDAVITGGEAAGVPTAIVCPPTIVGVGHGPVKQRSIQIPWLAEAILKRGKGFSVGPAENYWDYVHNDDLASAFILLTEHALDTSGSSAAAWGKNGYYFVETGEFQWKTMSTLISSTAHSLGALASADVDQLSVEDASKQHPYAPLLWGSNCRSRSDRFRALGWTPKIKDFTAAVQDMVKFEVEGLGDTNVKASFDKA